jgi:hypothetical protein
MALPGEARAGSVGVGSKRRTWSNSASSSNHTFIVSYGRGVLFDALRR